MSSFPTKKGDVAVRFRKEDDIEKVLEEIQLEDKETFENKVKVSSKLLPKLKVFNIPNYVDLNDLVSVRLEILNGNVNVKNLVDKGSTLEVLFKLNFKHGQGLVIKCTPDIRNKIRANRWSLKFGAKLCKVQDSLFVKICSNCCGVGHSKTQCKKSQATCTFCASDHLFDACPIKNEPEKYACKNCTNSNKHTSKNHSCFSMHCPFVLAAKKSLIDRTNWDGNSPSI